MPTFPPTRPALVLLSLSVIAFLVALYFQAPMWVVELTAKNPSAGGGEHLVSLIFGLPSMILALLLVAPTILVRAWRNRFSLTILIFESLLFTAWLGLLVKEALR